jgi:polygalacturonase
MKRVLQLLLICIIIHSCSVSKRIYFGIPGVVKVVGNTIYLQTGEIKVTEPFTIPDGVTILGNNTTFTFNSLKEYPIIRLNNSSNITLKNINIKGEKLVIDKYPTTYYFWLERNNFIQIHNAKNITLENCNFENSYGTVIHVADSQYLKFKKCTIKEVGLTTHHTYNYSYDGIFIGGQNLTSNIEIDSCTFYNIGKNFPFYKDEYSNDGDGVHLLVGMGARLEDIKITNCIFDGCGARGVKIQDGKRIYITKNKFLNSTCGVVMAIKEPIYDIDLSNNYHKEVLIPYSSETMGPSITVYNLIIKNNEVKGLCNWFIRTGGGSKIENGVFENNVVENSGMHAFAGRFDNSRIVNNKILSFGSMKKIYHMALEISPECHDLLIENNYFGKYSEINFETQNYSKEKSVVIRNNKVEFSKTKTEALDKN